MNARARNLARTNDNAAVMPRAAAVISRVEMNEAEATSALIGLINHAHDVPRAEATQIIVIMVAFMPIGLTFFQALAAAVLITAFSAIAGLLIRNWADNG